MNKLITTPTKPFFIEGICPWSVPDITLPARTEKPTVFWLTYDFMLLKDTAIQTILKIAISHPQHRFCVLTEETRLLKKYMQALEAEGCMKFLPNFWVGTTLHTETESKLYDLLHTPAAGHFVHCNPKDFVSLKCVAHENVVFNAFTGEFDELFIEKRDTYQVPYRLGWVVIGEGDTPNPLPAYPTWVSSLVIDASEYEVPFYYTGSHWVRCDEAEAEKSVDFLGKVPATTSLQAAYFKYSPEKVKTLNGVYYQSLPSALCL